MMSFGANVYALPAGGVVSAGGASISSGSGSTTITQTTQNTAINWQSFNIAPGEAVRFIQPGSSSVALNRVLGSDPSSILGSLSANGKVFLVNPNGILFGMGAQVNVSGLVASTLGITDSDFMAGRYLFSGASDATVLNQGSINADGGHVALLGASVSNEGVILARLGTVALAAGTAITLDVAGDGLLNVTVNQGAVNALIQNGGMIQADGGQVLLTAQAAGNLLQSVVNNTGVIQAQTIENRNGTIKLLGDMQSGTVNVGGTLDVSGTGTGQTGSSVTVTGHHVGLFGGHIDASGDAGGGTVLIGGDYQGKNPLVQNASATYMSADSSISSDAITHGNGGKVVLWANDSTRAYGSITARGGAQSGDGGLIETSGHWLDVAGIDVSASATSGKYGTWLLDPFDVSITAASSAGTFGLSGITNTWTPSATASTVSNADISSKLETTNVTIQTNGNGGAETGTITVTAPITRATGGPAATTLTLTPDPAAGAIVIAASGSISGTSGNPLNVNLNASGGTVSVSAPITTFGGTFLSTGTTFTSPAGGTISTAGGTLTINHSGFVTISDNLSSAGGNISITGSDLTLTTPAIVDSGSGNVTLKPKTASSIGVGTGGGAFSAVTDEELTRITSTGTITIGDRALASAMIVGGITAGTKNLRLATGGTINDVGTSAVTLSTGTLTLDAASTIGNTTPFDVTAAKLVVKTEASFNINNAGTLTNLSITTNGAATSQNLVSTGLTTYSVSESGNNTTITNVASAGGLNFSYQNTAGNIDLGAVNVGSGTISVTSAGDLTLSGAVQTTNASTSAAILSAGSGVPAGNSTGGNILIAGGSIATGAGGRATLFTGSLAGSTGLTALVGSGSGNFRYNSNETSTNYTAPLGAGTYAIYREQPTLTITANSPAAITYGTVTPALTTAVSGVNGDTAGQALSTAATIAVAGSTSNSGNYTAASHTLTPSGAVDQLGYALTYVNGALAVTPLALAGSIATGSSIYGAALTPGAASFSNVVGSDVVTPGAVTVTPDITSTSGNLTAGSHLGIESVGAALAGADADNYSFVGAVGDYSVSPLNTPISGSRVYDATSTAAGTDLATIGALLAGDSVSVMGGGAMAAKDVGVNKAVTSMGTLALAGTDAGNYNLVNGELTVTPLAITGSITAADKTYDTTTAAAITGRTLAGVLGTDMVSYSGGTATFDTPVVGTGKTVTGTGLGLLGADAGNYTVNPIATTTATIMPVVVPEPPPIEITPDTTSPLAEEMLGVEQALVPAPRLDIVPARMTVVMPARTPNQLQSLVQPAAAVAPVVVPPIQSASLEALAERHLELYVTPYRPRKQDRN